MIEICIIYFFLDYFMLPDMVVSGNVTCAALQQAAASGEVDHDLWGRELRYTYFEV